MTEKTNRIGVAVLSKRDEKIEFWLNPFSAYGVSFLSAIILYWCGFSNLYPKLKIETDLILLSTILTSFGIAYLFSKIDFKEKIRQQKIKTNIKIFIFLIFCLVAECIYSKNIPLLSVLKGDIFDYQKFGIPTFHVAYVGLNFYYCTFWFDLYLKQKDKRFLWLALSVLGSALVIMSRGAFVASFLSWIFVFGYRREINKKFIGYGALLLGGLLWGFGWLGNARTSADSNYHDVTSEDFILTVGDASDSFRNSFIPDEYFWSYLYISSPLADFQNTVDFTKRSQSDTLTFLLINVVPDFISKRIVGDQEIDNFAPVLITEELTVSTMYGRAYSMLKWNGVFVLYIYFIIFCTFVILFLRGSNQFVTGISISSSMAVLCIFDNMLVFSGIISQIVVAILFSSIQSRSDYKNCQ